MTSATSAEPAQLRRNSVGLASAVIMSAAIMGPAVSTFFNPQFSTPFSGEATPFVYVVCLIVMLITASGVMEMAAVAPSAGSFYTYVSLGLGPTAGLVAGGLMFVAYALLPPIEIALIGAYLQQTIKQAYGYDIPWIAISIIPWIAMTVLALEGVRSTLRTAMTLFVLEVAVVLLMAVIVMASGGAHGITAAPLTPSASPNGLQGLVIGGVFAALSFVGFEGATTLGEEVRNPRRNVPLAIAFSTLVVGLIYAFCIWAEVIGLGPDKVNALTGSSTPWNDLASLYAPWMTLPIIIASVSSMTAVMINGNTGVVRVLFAMGREGMLPKALAYVDPKHGTPRNAVFFQSLLSALVVIGVGYCSGGLGNPDGGSNVYGFCGFVLTLAILLVYVLANIAAIAFFSRRGDGRPLRHMVLPALGALLIAALFIGQIVETPDPPYNRMPWMILAWLVLCVVGAWWLRMNRPDVLAKAGAVLAPED